MRLFFAIDLPHDQKLAIHKWRDIAYGPSIEAIPIDNFHITLAFLGEVKPPQLESLIHHAEELEIPPFEVSLDHVGFFVKPKINWLGVQHSDAIQTLAKQCKAISNKHRLASDKNTYTPHVSLHRDCEHPPALPLIEPGFNFTASHFGLYQSNPRERSVRYQCIQRFALQHSGRYRD